MSKFVLVHGAWHGAWAWEKVVPLLKDAGHEVVTFDLPGHGEDATETRDVSLQAYTDRVVEELDASDEEVILVGHSMGGLPITQAAGQRPGKVAKLVYLTAFLLEEGQTLLDVSGPDNGLVIPNLEFSEDQSSAVVKDEIVREAFYGDCTDEDVAWAKERLVWQAAAPFATPISLPEDFASIPKVFIECTKDRAITIGAQRMMHSTTEGVECITMHTSHSPFLSAPEELARNLDAIATREKV